MFDRSSGKVFDKFPLKLVLIAPFIALTLLTVGLVALFSFRSGQLAVNDVARQLRGETTKRIEEHLRPFLNMPHQINQLNAAVIREGLLRTSDPLELERFFWRQTGIFDSVTSVYFGTPEGGLVNSGREGSGGARYVISTDDFKSGPFRKYAVDSRGNRTDLLVTVPDFDCRTRPWYNGAARKESAFWSDVYILFTGQEMAISASLPVYDEQRRLLGVVAVDLFLSHLGEFLKTIDVSENSHSFIMEPSGLLIASSNGESPFTASENASDRKRIGIEDSSIPLVRSAANALKEKFGDYRDISSKQYLEFKLEGSRHFLLVSPVRDPYGLNWIVATMIPESDFLARIYHNRQVTIWLIAVAMLLTVGLGVALSRWITNPISRLNVAAKTMARGDLDLRIGRDERIREIAELTSSFNHMGNRLKETVTGLSSEIAERKEAESELKRQKEILQTINDNIPVMITLYDPSAKMIFVNREFEKKVGWRNEELEHVDIMEKCYPDPEERAKARAYMKKATTEWNEFSVTAKSGAAIPSIWSNVLVGDIRIGIGIDVTEKKKLEEQLRHSQKMESLGVLAGGIAHEFNNILGIVMGNTELALNYTTDKTPAKECLRRIDLAAVRARDIVRQLMTFSRKSDNTKETTPVGPIVKDAVRLIRSTISSEIEIRLETSETSLCAEANATQIHQLMINLCGNAADAMEERRGEIAISVSEAVVADEKPCGPLSLKPGHYVKIVVADTGTGMDKDVLERIFDPFFTTKEVGKGTGLGLAVCHSIVEQHSGSIFVESVPGMGTEFGIYLPSASAEGTVEQKVEPEAPVHSGTVLFVDDEPALVEIASDLLEISGYSANGATDPAEALEIFKRAPHAYDIVVTDMSMPGMTGLTLAKEILKLRPKTPVILCTGYSDQVSEESAKKAGIAKFLQKPVKMNEFIRTIRTLLDRSKKAGRYGRYN